MEIKENTVFLMLKINTPPGIDFLLEHKVILEKNGEVWFCRFGKTNVIESRIIADGNYIFFKDSAKNDNKIYMGIISEISKTEPTKNFPAYYDQIKLGRPLWFRLCEIKEVIPDLIFNNFRTKSSNATLAGVYRSMCQSFYIQCISDVII